MDERNKKFGVCNEFRDYLFNKHPEMNKYRNDQGFDYFVRNIFSDWQESDQISIYE
jgi:hypothetical protein